MDFASQRTLHGFYGGYDVTIVGAGLAGLQCARLLARKGLRVLLVDRKHELDQKIHTTGIFVRRTLLDFDIPADCLGPPIKHVTLYSPARRPMEFISEHDEFCILRLTTNLAPVPPNRVHSPRKALLIISPRLEASLNK